MVDRRVGGGGAYYLSSPKKGGLIRGRGLTEGFNIGFTAYFTIIEVKQIIPDS